MKESKEGAEREGIRWKYSWDLTRREECPARREMSMLGSIAECLRAWAVASNRPVLYPGSATLN